MGLERQVDTQGSVGVRENRGDEQRGGRDGDYLKVQTFQRA